MKRQGYALLLDYRLLAHVRELLQKERHRIWMEKYAPNIKRNTPAKIYKDYYKKIIEDNRNPWLVQGRCNLILDQIDEIEQLIQMALKGRNMYCDECKENSWVLKEEPPKSELGRIFHLPHWRELACGHVISLTGKVLPESHEWVKEAKKTPYPSERKKK